ncbi:MAG: hypothetical protein HYZ28_23330 [Myxococcales bacterium]|nr:hypothetical protein [Myxococcales bacterium]
MCSRLLAVCAALAPLAAPAGSVYLNNVNIDGVTNQRFEKVSVRIDEKGNVFIDAPGYAVKAVEGAPRQTPRPDDPGPGTLTRRYWMVTEQTVPGMTEYDVDVYINAKWIRKLRNNEEQIVTEITKHLTPGKNTVLLTARKVPVGQSRKSFSPEHVFRVIIGEGNVGGDNVMIDSPLVKFERSAADTADVSQEYTFSTR